MWQLLFITVNDLNGVSKKDQIEHNWRKLGSIWTYKKIRTDLTKLDKNWDKKGILTYFILFGNW